MIKLNHPISGSLDVYSCCGSVTSTATNAFQVSPDGERVVYWVRDFLTDEISLHSVRSDGSGHVNLSQQVANSNPPNQFLISPDSKRVVYYADSNIYRVPITGGTPIALTPSSVNSATDFKIGTDSDRVFYLTSSQLYSVPISGGNSLLLSPNIVNASISFKLSRDGGHIVYWGRAPEAERADLYSLSLADDSERKLVSNLSDIDVDAQYPYFEISPDSANVIFLVTANNLFQGVYSVPIDGGEFSTISTHSPVSGHFYRIKISSDSRYVAYSFSPPPGFISYMPAKRALYLAPIISGGAAREIGLGLNTQHFEFTPDSSRIVYSSAYDSSCDSEFPDICGFSFRIYSESINGDDVRQLIPDNSNPRFLLTADGESVVFTLVSANTRQIFSTRIDGGALIKLNSFFDRRNEVYTYNLSPDGQSVLYLADQDVDGVLELYSAPTFRNEEQRPMFLIKAKNGKIVILDL